VTLTSGSGTPTGTVTFKRGGAALGPGTLAAGAATFSTAALPVGMSSITASYPGDAFFAPVNSAVLSQKVNKAATTTSLSSSSSSFTYGNTVTLTATVSATAGTPTGSVTFKDGATSLGTAPVVAGVATHPTNKILAGNRSLTAVYGGNLDYNSSTSPVTAVTVAKATTSIVLSAPAPNPSTYLQIVTLTATITSPTTTPAGSLTLKDGAKTVLSLAIPVNGIVTFQTKALLAGTHSLTAVYAGSANVAASTSNAVSQVVNPLPTATTLAPATVAPIVYGQTLTFTATVTAAGATPTGVVAFQDGATIVKKNLVGGVATWTPATPLVVGSHSIAAAFLGSANFMASTAPGATAVSVSQAVTTTSLTSTAANINYGQTVTFTATVTSPTLTPVVGTVTFKNGAVDLKANVKLTAGVATFTTLATQTAGGYSVTAVFNPTVNITTSTSASVPLTIAKLPTTMTIASSLNPSLHGQTVTYAVTVSSAGPTPGGAVTLKDGGISLGAKTLSAGGTATYSKSYAAAGSHAITGSYPGNANFLSSTASLTQNVN
jgi:hypothetical protein